MKRLLDLSVVCLFLPIWFPVLCCMWAIVVVKMGTPACFYQERVGLGGRHFRLIKFRSMTSETDERGVLLPDELRLTGFGRWLRSTSLDELPEMINILIGDMSLVGPRPLLPQYTDRYSPRQARRLEILPGLTGWAQINGRNATNWEDRFEKDVWYVDNRSILLDIKILFLTVSKVLNRHGISESESETMSEFCGSKDRERKGDLGS
jgi:sugar transferase EpsL